MFTADATATTYTASLVKLLVVEQLLVDDDAMNTLWVGYDGAALLTSTAADVAAVLATIDAALDDDDAATLLGWMRSTTATAADGFHQRYGVLGPAATGTAAKQGWMCCVDARRQLHSPGILADGRVVVLLGDFPSGTSWAQAQGALDAAAAAVVASTA